MKDNGKDGDLSSQQAKIIQVDEQEIRSHVEEVVRDSMEKMLNTLLDDVAALFHQAIR